MSQQNPIRVYVTHNWQDSDDYQRVFEVNELGPFLGMRAVAGPMAAGGGGSIVIISSIDGMYVAPFTAAYAGSKFAVRGLAKVAALELGSFVRHSEHDSVAGFCGLALNGVDHAGEERVRNFRHDDAERQRLSR